MWTYLRRRFLDSTNAIIVRFESRRLVEFSTFRLAVMYVKRHETYDLSRAVILSIMWHAYYVCASFVEAHGLRLLEFISILEKIDEV